jgi:hypothetical protein
MTRLLLIAAGAAALAGCTSPASSEPAPRPKQASPEPAPPGGATFSSAEYAEHVQGLRERLQARRLGHLDIRIEPPFVVAGDGMPEELERSLETVRWASAKLEQDFFARRPAKILEIFLFATEESYERGVQALTGKAPGTPYGFYSSAHGGLFMNISTGGGTLVHEIVHPYVEADFPSAPPWLNEGLGSLFEQSAERAGHIVGLTNWRLAGLQRAIARGGLPSFRKLTGLGSAAFYRDDSGTSYAQSRYLLYYLQERGLLRDFYRAFRVARGKDPTGYATLVQSLGERDMDAFQRRWERYVSTLRFP